MQRFRGGLVSKAHRLLYHSTLGLRVIKKMKKKSECRTAQGRGKRARSARLRFVECLDCATHALGVELATRADENAGSASCLLSTYPRRLAFAASQALQGGGRIGLHSFSTAPTKSVIKNAERYCAKPLFQSVAV